MKKNNLKKRVHVIKSIDIGNSYMENFLDMNVILENASKKYFFHNAKIHFKINGNLVFSHEFDKVKYDDLSLLNISKRDLLNEKELKELRDFIHLDDFGDSEKYVTQYCPTTATINQMLKNIFANFEEKNTLFFNLALIQNFILLKKEIDAVEGSNTKYSQISHIIDRGSSLFIKTKPIDDLLEAKNKEITAFYLLCNKLIEEFVLSQKKEILSLNLMTYDGTLDSLTKIIEKEIESC